MREIQIKSEKKQRNRKPQLPTQDWNQFDDQEQSNNQYSISEETPPVKTPKNTNQIPKQMNQI